MIVHTEDSGMGSGSDHLVTMLRLLALCERRSPDDGNKTFTDPSCDLGHESERGYTVAVIPWLGPETTVPNAADRVLYPTQIEALTHAF